MGKRFTVNILVAAVLGVLVGAVINATLTLEQAKSITGVFSLATDLFLRLIKMIIAPLVFATLVSGIAHMGSAGSIGRTGGKTMAWFLGASVVSLTVGMVMATLLDVGAGFPISLQAAPAPVASSGLSLQEVLTHLVPTSVAGAMANTSMPAM